MTSTDPTPLAEQIAREHYLTTRAKCACPDALDAGGDMHAWVAHIATVTEQAVRERVAGDERRRLVAALRAKFGATNRAADYIERLPDGWADHRAARIARGDTHA